MTQTVEGTEGEQGPLMEAPKMTCQTVHGTDQEQPPLNRTVLGDLLGYSEPTVGQREKFTCTQKNLLFH